jgi:hypothetical protein
MVVAHRKRCLDSRSSGQRRHHQAPTREMPRATLSAIQQVWPALRRVAPLGYWLSKAP